MRCKKGILVLVGEIMEIIDYKEENKKLLCKLEEIERLTYRKKQELNKLQIKPIKENTVRKEATIIQENVTIKEVKESQFEDEIKFYLINYRLLRDNFTMSEIKSILPRKNNPEYINIMLRLSLESIKEIKELKQLLMLPDIDQEEQEICNKYIDQEKRKVSFIKELLQQKDEEKENEEQNNIILIPTVSGNIRIIEELKHIPIDYYDGFKELIESIVNGSFKNVKMLRRDNDIIGACEVKLFKIRVVFIRLNINTYALVTAFVKKSDNDKLYRESLNNKLRDYYSIEEKIKGLLSSPEFLAENEKNVQEMWSILHQENKEAKQIGKEK